MRSLRMPTGLTILLLACGGEPAAPNPPDPIYPAVAGNYAIDGTFSGIPTSDGWIDGTFSLQQPSLSESTLSGTSRITVHLFGEEIEFVYPLTSASVTAAGRVTFSIRDSPTDVWTFSGQNSVNAITGSHTLVASGGGSPITGNFTATRSGSTLRAPVRAMAETGSFTELMARLEVRATE
ncbi:MAG TPA: hypothetical protein VF037_10730 [Gemmatimonadales bacterium]